MSSPRTLYSNASFLNVDDEPDYLQHNTHLGEGSVLSPIAGSADRELDISGTKKRMRLGSENEEKYSTLYNSNEMKQLNHTISKLKSQLKEQELLHYSQTNKLQNSNNKLTNEVAQLKAEIELLNDNESRTRDELKEKQVLYLKQKHTYEDKIYKLDKEIRSFKSIVGNERVAAKEAISELKTQIEIIQSQENMSQNKIEQLQSELNAYRTKLEECKDYKSLKNQLEKCMEDNNTLKYRLNCADNNITTSTKVKQLEEKLRNCEKANRNLVNQLEHFSGYKDQCTEAMHEKDVLVQELNAAKLHRDELLAVEAERDCLLSERNEWKTIFQKLLNDVKQQKRVDLSFDDDNNIAKQALKLLSYLQQERNSELKSKGDVEIKLGSSSRRIAEHKTEINRLEDVVAALRGELSSLKATSDLHEKRNIYLTRERDSLTRVIESINQERDATSAQPTASGSKEKEDRYAKSLESSLNTAREHIQELEDKLGEMASSTALHEELSALKTTNQQLTLRVKQLSEENQQFKLQLDNIYNPKKTKILHMCINPSSSSARPSSSQQQQEQDQAHLDGLQGKLNELEAENQSLRAELESKKQARSDDGGASCTKAADPMKRHERLKELFRVKTHAFKEAVYLLTGFKIDMSTDNKPHLRVRSMYAEKESDYLLFQWQMNSGRLELLETEFCKRLDENIFAYLTKCNSVPAFLSTLTLDLFERQTFTLQ